MEIIQEVFYMGKKKNIRKKQNEPPVSSYNNDGKKLWLRILVLVIACAMLIGIITMPLMSIYR